jgi:hypothetical protein
MNDLLTAKQLAECLQLTEFGVKRLMRKGAIPHVRPTPRVVRFHLGDVIDALRRRERPKRGGKR